MLLIVLGMPHQNVVICYERFQSVVESLEDIFKFMTPFMIDFVFIKDNCQVI